MTTASSFDPAQLNQLAIAHQRYIRQHDAAMPEVRDWKWGVGKTGNTGSARK